MQMRVIDKLIATGYRRRLKGTGRVAAALYGAKPGRSVPTRLNGLRWEADPLDWMDQQILSAGTYEPETTQALLRLLPEGGVFWDIGANAGVHSLSVKRAAPGVQVVAFEPSPAQYARLRHNAALNGLSITAYCVALAEQRGYRSFNVVDVGNSGHNSLIPWESVTYAGTFPCWCDTGDDLIRDGVPVPSVMKIDVEGAEEAVLGGMRELLARPELRHVIYEGDGGLACLTDAGFTIEHLGTDWLASKN